MKTHQKLARDIIRLFSGGTDQILLEAGVAYQSTDHRTYLANNGYLNLILQLGYLRTSNEDEEVRNFENLETLCEFVILTKAHNLDLP